MAQHFWSRAIHAVPALMEQIMTVLGMIQAEYSMIQVDLHSVVSMGAWLKAEHD